MGTGSPIARRAAFADGAARLAILMRAASCDHLEQVNKGDIQALGKSETVATLLPGCDFHLGLKKYAPARALIEAGAIVALATDYNPGRVDAEHGDDSIAGVHATEHDPSGSDYGGDDERSLCAAAGKKHRVTGGCKQADIAVFEVADYREIPYYFGVDRCWMTVKRGRVIHAAEQTSI